MKKNILVAIFISIFQFLLVGTSFCQNISFPEYTGYINDYADILSDETKSRLTSLADEIERKTTSQLAIVTIDTTSPLDIETFAVKLFEKWRIGQKGKNNGVLLLIAAKDRNMRIEVGYGLEGAIPDVTAKIIIENYMIPSFKNGDYDSGVIKGAVEIGKLIAKEYNIELSQLDNLAADITSVEKPKYSPILFNFLFLLFIIIIRMSFFWVNLLRPPSRRRNNGFWYGGGFGGNSGGFGGGFGGFGGGFSGGGGASGRW